ncbi:murein transglycosylase A [Aurantimonas endophytica]|uniref:peptidoglycan lytic exotransglycosylase n=1 Tax=Aurantimonas endophytica TaxID=1522175 RepID=A0A7W6HH17_9HYPH|nr:MltA domain-containing protein [Aurantimonas endophytica]MBB4005110.1 membrane-bound lytic murein transglycosylase A [Aurantimonas endophytica]MCO6406225.1 transglycosylase [Aurantimonas endophytica]
MVAFRRRRFADLPEWSAAEHGLAYAAFRRGAGRFLANAVRTGTLGIDAAAFHDAAAAAVATERDGAEARAFFEQHFVPLQIVPDAVAPEGEHGFVTGYYEPVVEASAVETSRFRFPLYAPPPELVKIDDVSRPPGMDPSFRFARRKSCGLLEEHPDRAAIEAGLLRGRGLEIAWLADPVEAFFIHIQGSARLQITDGSQLRVGFAAKSGHPFTAIGRLLVDSGELTLAEADMDGIRAWLAAHPERQRALFDRNRSFIFFQETAVDDPSLGPVGAAQVPLTALASIAVDRELATFGVPYFITASQLPIDSRPFRRLMIAQDTGSAIIGPARADIYVGSGPEAGKIAGRIRHAADFTVLVPPSLAESLAR